MNTFHFVLEIMETGNSTIFISNSFVFVGFILAGFIVTIVVAVIYKSLRTPRERNLDKLWLKLLPKPRWWTQKHEIIEERIVSSHHQAKKKCILLLTYGTRGDVQPLVALAQELNLRGDEQVYICTAESFRSFVEDQNNVKFVTCGVEVVEQPTFLFDSSAASSFADVLQVVADVYPSLSQGMWAACQQIRPDLILSQAVVRGIGAQCAEKLGVPHWCIHFAPSNTPTFDFPPPEYPISSFKAWNKLNYLHRNIKIAKAAIRTGLSKEDEEFRRDVLKLPSPLDPLVLLSDIEREPSIHAYSPILQPKPNDWPDWHLVVGAFRLKKNENKPLSTLDPTLHAFLDAPDCEKPIYVGFGSMEGAQEQFSRTIRCVVEQLKLRAVICADATTEALSLMVPREVLNSENVLVIKSAPHDLLFPKCRLVIHHGGAGTTNAAIQAGVPQIVLPILAWSDQPFWANVVQRLGLGFRCSTTDTNELTSCVLKCLKEKSIMEKAQAMKHAEHPDGARITADLIRQVLMAME